MSLDLAIGTLSINLALTIPPLLLIVFGILALKVIPRKPNWIMGYRTSKACKNQDTWTFTHKYWGKWMVALGIILTALTVVGMILIEQGTLTLDSGSFLGLSAIATVAGVSLTMIPVEIALRKAFDKDGRPTPHIRTI